MTQPAQHHSHQPDELPAPRIAADVLAAFIILVAAAIGFWAVVGVGLAVAR